jgi:hypothetical protein
MAANATVDRSSHFTLTGSQVYELAIKGNWSHVEVLNRDATGGDVLYFRYGDADDTTAPTVAGANSIVVLPQQSVVFDIAPNSGETRTVKLISAGTPDVSVTGF